MSITQVRSIPEEENYATYLALPLLNLNKNSYDEGFLNAYFTNNGKILVLLDPDCTGNSYWSHPDYLTDLPTGNGLAVLYRCPKQFEQDMSKLINSEFSKISEEAKQQIYRHSTLIVDFTRKDKVVVSSPLIHSLRCSKEEEREPRLREQDFMDNIDADITFREE